MKLIVILFFIYLSQNCFTQFYRDVDLTVFDYQPGFTEEIIGGVLYYTQSNVGYFSKVDIHIGKGIVFIMEKNESSAMKYQDVLREIKSIFGEPSYDDDYIPKYYSENELDDLEIAIAIGKARLYKIWEIKKGDLEKVALRWNEEGIWFMSVKH